MLTTKPLTWMHCMTLAHRLAEAEAQEVLSTGLTTKQALAAGQLCGPGWAVLREGGEVVGAYGWNPQGVIWSLWAPLTRGEARQVLRDTPKWVATFLADSHLPWLFNYVHEANIKARAWLKASKCFEIDTSVQESNLNRQPVYFFRTKPLEEIALCATQ